MNDNENSYFEMNMADILKTIWNYKFIVIIFITVFTMLMAVKSIYFTEDTYTARGVIYVSSRSDDEESSSVEKNDIDASRLLISTYIETLKIRTFLEEVSEEFQNKYSWVEIKDMMSLSTINKTELLSIGITANSPEDAYFLAKSVLELAPNTLSKVAKGGSVEILDEVKKPTQPDDKKLIEKIIVGGFLGGILSLVLIFTLTFFDTRIKKSEDIERRYDISILGIVEN